MTTTSKTVDQRRPYTKPTLVAFGDLRTMTLAKNASGRIFDGKAQSAANKTG